MKSILKEVPPAKELDTQISRRLKVDELTISKSEEHSNMVILTRSYQPSHPRHELSAFEEK